MVSSQSIPLSVLVPPGTIFEAHLRPLMDYLTAEGIPFERLRPDQFPSFREGVVISCRVPSLSHLNGDPRYFTVMVAHNLTGVKGSNFHISEARLNIVPGVRQAWDLEALGKPYVIGGYAKWDIIYKERFTVDGHRADVRQETAMAPEGKVVVFYPTESGLLMDNLDRTDDILRRMNEELPSSHLFLIIHAGFAKQPVYREVRERLTALSQDTTNFHLVDGSNSLRYIAACDLFITDMASSVITALSMKKPTLFLKMEATTQKAPVLEALKRVKEFQSFGVYLGQVKSLKEFIEKGDPRDRLVELFDQCVAFDDDRNCYRIMTIVDREYRAYTGG